MTKVLNKRKTPRIDCSVPVDGQEGGIFAQVKTIDFSKGGLGLISQSQIPLNEEIAVEIDLGENEEPVLVLGKVKWVRPLPDSSYFRVGLSFETVLSGIESRLNQYFSA